MGLPPGVTADFSSGTITLSGTPTQPGTYNYSIPLIGGCGTVNATGTLTVTPVYELTSTTSVSPSSPGGSATVTIRGTTTNIPNGTYEITYSLGLANSGTFTTTVNVVNGRGIFTTAPISDPELTSLEILTIRRPTDSCTITLTERNLTFFGTCAAVFDANGEFFVPAGITEITISVWGGGAGGGRGSNNGGGGGGGGFSRVNIPVSPGNVLNVVIGTGGNGQTNQTASQNGSPTYVTRNPNSPDPQGTSIVYAQGGNRGTGGTPGSGGEGNTANGQNGSDPTNNSGGNGGNGGGTNGGSGGNNVNGANGTPPGGGGGGSTGNGNGGNGGQGLVIISYSCPPIDPDGCFTVIDDGSRSGATIIEFTCDSNWIAPEGLLDFEVVVIGGGGGGGMGFSAGGGGAGGFSTGYVSTTSDFGMPDGTTFNVNVGQGGLGAPTIDERGQNGGSSSLTGTLDASAINVSAEGGGGGGSFGSTSVANGAAGASGGGGAIHRPTPPNAPYKGLGGAGNTGNGHQGSSSDVQIFQNDPNAGAAAGGGGGGAGGPGVPGSAAGQGQSFGGNGGAGRSYDLYGNIIQYGGGGGGVGYNFNGNPIKNGEGGLGPNGAQLGGNGVGDEDGIGQDGIGIGSGGGAGREAGGNGSKGRVFIIYSNVRILPVEFLFVHADYNHHSREIILNWATAKEWENSHFEIERSVTGIKDFKKVGEVEGMGWTDQITEYEFVDKQLPLGAKNLLYRLKQVDFNGNFEYSEVVSVRVPGVEFTQGVWRAYPNPTNGSKLRISLMDRSQYEDERLSFRIIHPMYVTPAKTVDSEAEMNELLEQLAMRVPKGVFVVEIQWRQKVEHIKVLKQLQ